MLFGFIWIIANVVSSAELDKDKENEESKIENRYPTTVYVFLPVAGLIFLFFRQNIFNKLLLLLDRRCLSILCPSFSQREQLLKWACNRLPSTWSSHTKTLAGGVADLWADGSLLCTLINTAIPGACPNPHRHWNKPPSHAQAIAYKYLAVIPIFTEKDLSGRLNARLERNFLFYLKELQHSISRLNENDETIKQFSSAYIPRGMGLFSGEQHKKTIFYVYANPESTACNYNTIIQIRGPYGTYGQAMIPKFQKKVLTVPDVTIVSESMISKKRIKHSKSIKFLENFPFSFTKYHKKHMGDNIIIDVSIEKDRAKITYIPKNYGMYEIIMISNGELLTGCPYHVHIFNNTSGIEDNFEEEDNAEIIPKYRKRKVISKTIDLIDNNLPLSEFHEKFQKYKVDKINITKDIIAKPTFNFREVVEEITRNGKMFKNLVTKDNINDDSRQTLLHIQCEDADLPEIKGNRENVVDNHSLEITPYVENNFKNILEIAPIPEAEEKESVVSSENDNYQEPVFEKHNLESVIENDVIKSQNTNLLNIAIQLPTQICNENTNKLEVNTEVDESTLDNNFEYKDPKQIDSDVVFVENRCENPITVNKIRIPEKFCDQLRKTLVNELGSKHYKNVVNNCSKPINKYIKYSQYPDKIYEHNYTKRNKYYYRSEDFNNNIKSDLYQVARNLEDSYTASKKSIPTLDSIEYTNPKIHCLNTQQTQHTSPICPDHIESEVDYTQMSVAEKRKIFAEGALPSLHNTSNNSFSENEGSASSTSIKNYNFEGLSVLNVLKSLKESQSISNTETYSLSSTKSLPDISLDSEYISCSIVKVKKHFWESISLRSSSSINISRSSSAKSSSSYKNGKLLSQLDRDKELWKIPSDQNTNQVCMDKSSEIYKSADDILSMTETFQHQHPKKYKSMDTSLDTCTILSIDERKKILLKQNYEKEKMNKKYFNSEIGTISNTYMNKKCDKTEKKRTLNNEYSSMKDKIGKYNSVSNLSFIEEEISANNDIRNRTSYTNIPIKPQHKITEEPVEIGQYTFKSQFKRAVKYFKNLETQCTGKIRSKTITKNNRKLSLDFSVKKKGQRRGGSLNLANVSDRFSVSNLYEDMYDSKTDSFRCMPNRNVLLEALATFSHDENELYNTVDNDDIEFEVFKRRAKLKKRKSVKSIFNLYH